MAGPIPLFGTWSIQFWYRASAAPSDLHFLVTLRHPDGRLEERLESITSFTTDRTTNRVIVVPNGTGNAEIVDAVVTGNFAAMKRGQFYVVGVIIPRPFGQYAGDDEYGRRFLRGYLYENHNVVLGDDVEPGPGGGEGFTLANPITAATAIGGDFILDLPVPTNAYRKIHHLEILYQAAASAGTRNVIVSLLDEDSRETGVYTTSTQVGPTNAQSARVILTRFGDPTTNRPQPGTGNVTTSRFLQSGPIRMSEGYAIRVEDIGDIDATDTVAFFGVVEEWLVL